MLRLSAGRKLLFFLGKLPKMAWPEKSVVERLLLPPVRRLWGGDLMSGLSLHPAVCQGCGLVSLRGPRRVWECYRHCHQT